jgi:hypothetical protein
MNDSRKSSRPGVSAIAGRSASGDAPYCSSRQGVFGARAFETKIAVASLTATLASWAGCAAAERVPTDLAPDALIQWINSEGRNRLALHGDPTPPLKARVTALRKNCEASGGQLNTAFTTIVFKDRKPTNYVFSTSINDFMSCMQGYQPIWGATMSVDKPELLNGVITSGNDFYGDIQLRYLDADQTREELARREELERRRRDESLACQAEHERARAQLRSKPQIGQDTQLGTVIDVRVPMVQLQLNTLERQRRGRNLEWVKAELLDPISKCH